MATRIALYQGPGEAGNVDANLATLAAVVERAAEAGAGLAVFPEMFLSGYNIADATFQLAEPAEGHSRRAVAAAARRAGVAVLYGYPERAGTAIYNAAALVGRDGGALANYRKVHLYGAEERRLFRHGDRGFSCVDVDGLRVGILICYDVEFPEAVRTLALEGAELIAVPTALFGNHGFISTTVVPARAWENQVFVAYANRCGREGDLRYTGLSCVVAPDGRDLARAGTGEELILADLDGAAYAKSRADNPYLADRRPDLYSGDLGRGPADPGETGD